VTSARVASGFGQDRRNIIHEAQGRRRLRANLWREQRNDDGEDPTPDFEMMHDEDFSVSRLEGEELPVVVSNTHPRGRLLLG
jgi:hypothetical protein